MIRALDSRIRSQPNRFQETSVTTIDAITFLFTTQLYVFNDFLFLQRFYESTVCETVRPYTIEPLSVCMSCLSVCLSVCNVGVLWPNSWMDQDETWHKGRPRPGPHCVRWGPSSPSQKGHNPQFSAHVGRGQTAGWIKMALGREVDLGPCDIVLDGDPAAPKKGSQHPLPNFGPCLLWPNGRPSQLLLSTCFYNSSALTEMGDRGHSSVGCHFSA